MRFYVQKNIFKICQRSIKEKSKSQIRFCFNFWLGLSSHSTRYKLRNSAQDSQGLLTVIRCSFQPTEPVIHSSPRMVFLRPFDAIFKCPETSRTIPTDTLGDQKVPVLEKGLLTCRALTLVLSIQVYYLYIIHFKNLSLNFFLFEDHDLAK